MKDKKSNDTYQAYRALHLALAKALTKKIEAGEATAAELEQARRLLDDNGIDDAGLELEGGKVTPMTKGMPFSDPDEFGGEAYGERKGA